MLKILGAVIILPVLFIIPHLSKEVVFESLGTVCILGSMVHRGQMREKGESLFCVKTRGKTGFGTLYRVLDSVKACFLFFQGSIVRTWFIPENCSQLHG